MHTYLTKLVVKLIVWLSRFRQCYKN